MDLNLANLTREQVIEELGKLEVARDTRLGAIKADLKGKQDAALAELKELIKQKKVGLADAAKKERQAARKEFRLATKFLEETLKSLNAKAELAGKVNEILGEVEAKSEAVSV